ncbi:hypothetical protein BDV12DRAFT_201497 [Aspergillus spectabilis]
MPGLRRLGTSDWAVDLQDFLYGEDGGSNGGDGDGGGLLYIAPFIWESDSPAVTCKPPCTFVIPPFPLETTSTVSWPVYTTPLLSSKENADIVTIATTITVSPFPIESIPWWPVTIGTSDPTSTEIELVQSVMPPQTWLTLKPNEATIPPTRYPVVTTTTNDDGDEVTTTTTIGDDSESTSTSTYTPVWYTTSKPVPLQLQPSISITTPSITIPTVTYSSGSINAPTTTPGCDGCGTRDCKLFGCGGTGGCGLFGCGGGCGIFGCGGGGCRSSGCGDEGTDSDTGSSNPLGLDPCPLWECGGAGCSTGSCGSAGCPNGDCSLDGDAEENGEVVRVVVDLDLDVVVLDAVGIPYAL